MSIHTRRLPTDSKVLPGVLVEPDAHTDRPERTEPARAVPPVAETTYLARPESSPPARAERVRAPVAAEETAAAPWYRTERWFLVQIAALVPALVAFIVPAAYRPPLWIAGGALLLVGLLMMARNELRRGRSASDFGPDAP